MGRLHSRDRVGAYMYIGIGYLLSLKDITVVYAVNTVNTVFISGPPLVHMFPSRIISL